MTRLSPAIMLLLSAWLGYLSWRVHRLEREVHGIAPALTRATAAMEAVVRVVTRAMDPEAEGAAKSWEARRLAP